MKKSFTLDQTTFDWLDFSESIIDFQQPLHKDSDIKIQAWGITLLNDPSWGDNISETKIGTALKEDLYIKGFSELSFTSFKHASLSTALYRDINPLDFLRNNQTEEPIRIEKSWQSNTGLDLYFYHILCPTLWPCGYSDIKITGDILSISIETDQLISTDEYLSDPRRHSISLF